MEEQDNFAIPMKWVDRIFDVMEEIYKERWTTWHGSEQVKKFYKTVWSHGLLGLTPTEIKNTILMLKNSSYIIDPPLVTDFYHYAKGNLKPFHRKYVPEVKINRELARKSMEEIKIKLSGKRSIVTT